MPSESTYKVGGFTFLLEFPTDLLSERELLHYAPFQTVPSCNEELLFTLMLIADSKAIPVSDTLALRLEDENGYIRLCSLQDGSMTLSFFSTNGDECCRMIISPDFSQAKAWIGGSDGDRRYALDSAFMLLYAFASARHGNILLHASAIECDGRAFLFLGKSGTGKSTHSRLWLDHIPGVAILNDDNPIVRIVDGKSYVYGSPWSGKTPCFRNLHLPIGGIVRLRQAPENIMTKLVGVKAYAALLPSCSGMKWNHEMAEAIHTTLCNLIADIPVFSLSCRPDKEAALLSYENLSHEL